MSSVYVFQNEKAGNRAIYRGMTLNKYLEDEQIQEMRKKRYS